MLITTLNVVIPYNLTPMPSAATRNIILVRAKAIAWPAIMLAKRRIIRANGFVNIPTNSIKGISGTGAFKSIGTSGQKISFQ